MNQFSLQLLPRDARSAAKRGIATLVLFVCPTATPRCCDYCSTFLPLLVWVYLYIHSNFCGGLRKTHPFRKSIYRSFKVIGGH